MQTTTEVSKPENKALTLGDVVKPKAKKLKPEDLAIPQVQLCQSVSDNVKSGDFKAGDVVRDGVKLTDATNKLEIVYLDYKKCWMLSEHPGGKEKGNFKGIVEMDSTNDSTLTDLEKTASSLPFKFKVDGAEFRRTKLLQVYCLLLSDLEAGTVVPSVVWLKKGAFNRAGKAVMSFQAFEEASGKLPQMTTLKLGQTHRSNDDGDWEEFTVSRGSSVDKKHEPTIAQWYQLVATSNVRPEVVVEETAPESVGKAKF